MGVASPPTDVFACCLAARRVHPGGDELARAAPRHAALATYRPAEGG